MTGPARRMAAVAAARHCIGTPFRLRGRTPGLHLDCIGLALVAGRAAMWAPDTKPDYCIRGDALLARLGTALAGAGLQRRPVGGARSGDLLLLETGPGLPHLGVRSPGGMVHAWASLRRVVESPMNPDWPVRSVWSWPGVED